MGKLEGLVVASVTPMHEDGSLDMPSFDAHLRDLLEAGVDGLFVAGTTGEGLLLEDDERLALVRAAVEVAAGRVPVVGHCGALTTARAVRLAQGMRAAGAAGVAVLTPFFYRIDAPSMLEHFHRVTEAAACPTYLYSIPSLTGVSLPREVVDALVRESHFAGIKFSHCDVPQLTAYLQTGARVLIGCDALIVEAVRAGAVGAVSGTAACYPAPYVRLFDCLRNGTDPQPAQTEITGLDRGTSSLPPIAGYKSVLVRRGIIASASVRRPLRRLTAAETATVEGILREIEA